MESAMHPFNRELADYLGAISPWMESKNRKGERLCAGREVSSPRKESRAKEVDFGEGKKHNRKGKRYRIEKWAKQESGEARMGVEGFLPSSTAVCQGALRRKTCTAGKNITLNSTVSSINQGQQALPSIWMLWDSGLENAPAKVRLCHRSWVLHNPDYCVRLLSLAEAELLTKRSQHISDAVWKTLKIQAKSDVIRIILLRDFGGVWVDASVLCLQPLSQWLNPHRFVTFRRDFKGRKEIYPWLTSWFLSAPCANHYVMERVVVEMDKFWLQPRPGYFYFWLHKIVASLCNSDSRFAEEVSPSTLESASGPHCSVGNRANQHMLKRCWKRSDLNI